MEGLPRMYGKMMRFDEGEERWGEVWREILRGCCDEPGMRIEMGANIAWGAKNKLHIHNS